ncbi:MAG TPA: helix-turn-helix transcriptional regulator [Ktedonobacteraceae bacterium]|nr:helix-turn-helix transcriptional regulator [Ktedonobacteraceae bacterium]
MEKLPSSWRAILAHAIANTQERARIARIVGVSPVTLVRWVKGERKPHAQLLARLPVALPQLAQELRSSSPDLVDDPFSRPPSDQLENRIRDVHDLLQSLYIEVVQILAEVSADQSFWKVSSCIARKVLAVLDAEQRGMIFMVLSATPPEAEGPVRSLYLRQAQGTPPWVGDVLQRIYFFGANTLVGSVIATGHARIIQDTATYDGRQPFVHVEDMRSLAAYPLQHLGGFSGCLAVSAALPHAFIEPYDYLLQRCAQLLALAIEPASFYPPERFVLGVTSGLAQQNEAFSTFRERILHIVNSATRKGLPMNLQVAQMVALQQLEKELVYVPQSSPVPDSLRAGAL